jgi:putative peptidoglycan lipid II flippase
MWSVMPEVERRTAGWWVFWLLTFLSILIALLLLLVAPVTMPVLAPGFSASTAQLTLALARIQSAAAIGAICTMMLSSLYHAEHQFIWPAVATLIWSLLGWFVLVAGLQYGGVTLAAWVQVLCHIGPVLFLAPAIGWLPPAGLCNLSAILANLWRQVKPLMVSTAFYRTGFVVDRLLASLLAPGSVVILELAWRINLAIIRVLNQGITTPVLPTLAALSSQGQWLAFKTRYRERLRWIARMSLGIVFGLGIVTLVALVMYQEHREGLGTLRPEDLSRLLTALLAGSGVLLCGSANHLLMSAFYAQGDTRTPTKIQMLSYMLGTGLKVGGFVLGGLYGIMAAMSIHYAVEGLALGVALDRRLSLRLRTEVQPSLELSPAGVPPRSP